MLQKCRRHPIQRRRKADPEIVSPRRFFGYLLSAQKVTYEKIIEKMRLVRVARAAASRSGGPLSFANAHVAFPAGCCPKIFPFNDVSNSLSRAVAADSINIVIIQLVEPSRKLPPE